MSGHTECQLSPLELAWCVFAVNDAHLKLTNAVFFQDMSRHPRWHLEICTTRGAVSVALNADEPLPVSEDRFDELLTSAVRGLRMRAAKTA